MRSIIGIDREKDIIVQKEWLVSLQNIAKMVGRNNNELQVLLGYISSVDTILKTGKVTEDY